MARTATRTRNPMPASVPEFKPDASTAIATGTVPVPPDATPADDTTPKAGDNYLPNKTEMHEAIDATLHALVDLEDNVDRARQKLAAQLLTRDHILRADDPTLPSLFDMAVNKARTSEKMRQPDGSQWPALFGDYLRKMVDEFGGPYVAERDCKTPEDFAQFRYRAKVNTRLDRALELLVYIAWLQSPVALFDDERGQWQLPPIAFVPFGWNPSGALFQEIAEDGKTVVPVTQLWLEPDNAGDSKGCWVSPADSKGKLVQVTQSLSQVTLAIRSRIAASVAPVKPAPSEATPAAAASARRRPRQPVATPTPTPPVVDENGNPIVATDGIKPDVAATDSDVPEADAPSGTADRAFYVANWNKLLVACGRTLAVDCMAKIDRSDCTDAAFNSWVEMVVMFLRMPGAIDAANASGAAIDKPAA